MRSYFVILLVLFRFSCGGILLGNIASSSALPTAFENVTRHLFQFETRMFINNYGVDLNTLTWLLLRNLNEKAMPFQLQNLEPETERVFINSSTLFTFNSFATFRAFNQKLSLTNEYYKPMQLFVFCRDAKVSYLKTIVQDVVFKASNHYMIVENTGKGDARLKTALEDHIQYEYFLIEETNCVKLMTFVWFASGNCGKLELIEINRFNKSTMRWKNEKFSINKLENFHGCDLVSLFGGTDIQTLMYVTIPYDLQNVLNYKLKRWEDGNANTLVDVVFQTGCMNAIDKFHRYDEFTPGSYSNMSFLTCFIYFSPVRMAVPPTENISEYAKLALPFDNFVWALIFLTFVIAFGTILVLYCVKRQIRDVVIGSNVSTPSLNVSQIFFGISQVAVPRGSFARFLAISFILYSLIIRTAWQGKMFEFMQKNITKPELQTVEEMIGKGYTFYMEKDFKKKFPETEIARRAIIQEFDIQSAADESLARRIVDTDFKGVVQMDLTTLSATTYWTGGRSLQRIRKEVLHVNICGLKFPHHHHFTGIFDLKTQQLFSAGIIQLHTAHVHRFLDPRRYKHLNLYEPTKLTMKKLEPGFVIWLASFSLAFAALLTEWLTIITNYILVKYILEAFYRMRHESEHAANQSGVKSLICTSIMAVTNINPITDCESEVNETPNKIKIDHNELDLQ